MGGSFQVDRDIFRHEIWSNIPEFRLFFFLVGNAVFSEEGIKKGEVVIKRGEFLRSLRNLRQDLVYFENNAEKYYSLSTIKRTVDKLVMDGRVKTTETKLGTLFSIVNYEYYQGFQRFADNSLELRENAERTQRERRENNNKKDKKDNNVNRDIKNKFGEFSNVRLNESEYKKLNDQYGDKATKEFIDKLDTYIESTGKKYKSHYATILNWIRKEPGIRKADHKKPTMTIDA